MKNSKGQNTKKNSVSDIWEDFSPFANSFDKLALMHWYLPTFGVYILAKLIGIPIWLREGQMWVGMPQEDGVYLLFAITLAIAAPAFNSWVARIPKVFSAFSERGLIQPRQKTDGSLSYLEFLTQYKRDLHSPKRFFVIVPLLLFVLGVVLLMANSPHDVASKTFQEALASRDTLKIVYLFLFYLGTGLVWTYFASVAAWITAVTGWYLWHLPVQFKVKIQPNHSDGAAGLLFFGNFCFRMVFPVLLASTFMAIIGPSGMVSGSPQLRLAANLVLFLMALPLSILTFVLPMWRIHVEMARIKGELEEYRTLRLASLDDHLQPLMNQKKFADAKKIVDEMNLVKASYPENVPDWPLNKTLFASFLIQQFISIGRLTLEAVSNQWLTSLKDFFGIR